MRAAALVREFDVRIRYTAFPLHPETPEDEMDLEDLFRGRSFDLPKMQEHLKRMAAELGVPMGSRRTTGNSRKAKELLKWAEGLGRGDAFRAAAYHAYFAEERNISRDDVLRGIAEAAGLPGADALEALKSGAYAAAVDADWARSRALGITAVPTFVAGGKRLTGFTDYRALAELAEGAGAVRRVGVA